MTKSKDQQGDTRTAAIVAAIEPVLAAHAVELADLAWVTDPAGLTLRVMIERPLPEGTAWRPELGFGVHLDDCALVSRAISALLDEGDLVPHAYILEVGSPGLDRPLHGERDFARFAGALARVKLGQPAPDGQRLLRGTLVAAAAGHVAVLVDGKRIEVPAADVESANLVFELPSSPKGAATKGAAAKKSGPKAGKQGSSAKRERETAPKPPSKKKAAEAQGIGQAPHSPSTPSPEGPPPSPTAPGLRNARSASQTEGARAAR